MKQSSFGMSYKKYRESHTVRHIADTVGFMYLFMLAIQLTWEFVALKWLLIAGVPLVSILNSLENPAIMLLLNVLLTALMFTVPFIVLCGREREKPKTLIHFGAPKAKTFLPLLLLGSGACLVANAAASIISQIMEMFGIKDSNVLDTMPEGVLGILLSVIAVSLAPAFLEEFAWRGITYGIVRKLGEGFALFVSAIMFAVMHMNMGQIPFAFLAGIILAFVYIKSESIWTAVAVHAINNFISVAMTYLLDNASAKTGQIFNLLLISLGAVAAIAGLYLYTRKGGSFKMESADMELEQGEKVKCFLKSPTIIISIIATALLLILL